MDAEAATATIAALLGYSREHVGKWRQTWEQGTIPLMGTYPARAYDMWRAISTYEQSRGHDPDHARGETGD